MTFASAERAYLTPDDEIECDCDVDVKGCTCAQDALDAYEDDALLRAEADRDEAGW